jgi:hypothetical protein
MPDKDKLGYAIGFNIASSAKKGGWDVDVDSIATAMKDVFAGKPTRFNETEVKEILTQLNQAMRAKMMADREKQMNEDQRRGIPGHERQSSGRHIPDQRHSIQSPQRRDRRHAQAHRYRHRRLQRKASGWHGF